MKAQNMHKRVDVIIPTYDSLQRLVECIQSMLLSTYAQPLRIIIVNNGTAKLERYIDISDPRIVMLNQTENLGWTGGLQKGLEISDSEYVVFANDDIIVPQASCKWLQKAVRTFESFKYHDIPLGAIGPSSNVVMGKQNIMDMSDPIEILFTSYLIGFCMILDRNALDKAGGVQHMQHGGDDLDLSIRLRKAGYHLMIDRNIFIFHHGFVTGEKVHGTPDKFNGWNSAERMTNTNIELIRKHGFLEYHNTILNTVSKKFVNAEIDNNFHDTVDVEGEEIRKFINGGSRIVELGCGSKKTVPHAVGLDRIPKGEKMPFSLHSSIADIVADVTEELPFKENTVDCIIARHILEHCVDTIDTLKKWHKPLKNKGYLIVACPDERKTEGITLNQEHVHAFTPESLKNIAELIGYKHVKNSDKFHAMSFVSCFEKI